MPGPRRVGSNSVGLPRGALAGGNAKTKASGPSLAAATRGCHSVAVPGSFERHTRDRDGTRQHSRSIRRAYAISLFVTGQHSTVLAATAL